MMKLVKIPIPTWPKLAWVAKMQVSNSRAEGDVHVLHGPLVETGKDWIVEAVWDEPFEAADIDRTDLIFGTGVRLRDGKVTFISSASGVDCLWRCETSDALFVSNSLPALLAVANLSLRDDYSNYTSDVMSVEHTGMLFDPPPILTTGSDILPVYYKNLIFTGSCLELIDKPDRAPHFPNYHAYREFLSKVSHDLKMNIDSTARKSSVGSLVGVSSGYDSPAAAVIAKDTGCTEAATIIRSNSIWRGSDSGAHIARALGMSCQEFRCGSRGFRRESTVWAMTGRAGGLNLTIFDYPQPLSVFFSGSYGDTVWDKNPMESDEPVGDLDSPLGEFRLWEGVFHCVIPWWGIRRAKEVSRIGGRDEMKPWRLGTNYDRPIARRLIEESGVRRGTFAVLKKNTSANMDFKWPRSPGARESMSTYLREHELVAPPSWFISMISRVVTLDALVHKNTIRKMRRPRGRRPWNCLEGTRRLFHWANWELKQKYLRSLKEAKSSMPDNANSRFIQQVLGGR